MTTVTPVTIIPRDKYEEMRDVFREYVLAAMDSTMNEIASTKTPALKFPDNCTGARDVDLPELFKALDAQFDRNLLHGGLRAESDAPATAPITPEHSKDELFRVAYEGRWFGAVWASTEQAALAKVRAMNPAHLPEKFEAARA